MIINADEFNSAFKNNFYLSEEYAKFCSKITGVSLSKEYYNKVNIFLLKNKIISISNYDEEISNIFRTKKLHFMGVKNILNKEDKFPSFNEYSIFFKKKYDLAKKNYKHSFKEGVRQSAKFPLSSNLLRGYNKEVTSEVYNLYKKQMSRLNSVIFPYYFFEEFMNIPNSFLLLIRYENKICAYGFCFENQNNVYFSIAGADKNYFKYRANNKLYDELIRYSCNNNKNIHLGMGVKNSGYQIFKENTGAINFKCERSPDHTKGLIIGSKLLKIFFIGGILKLISKLFPKKILFEAIPFT